ncbi:MAG: tRNA (adenosine(37)-N6)-dimethylallyltransferase MiaA [Coriobacteriia bacterium]|nr:tRNA (adenosine(37)-N6)-dimethylallyltransferase MiaA [Coriobacteriia bacterium]
MKERGYVIAIVGPTGVGKSRLAQDIAVIKRGVVLSADSMQIYRNLNIGTAKVLPENRRVIHYGLDLVDFGSAYSAAQYQVYARMKIDECFAKEILPVVCGGTGLYIRAALDEMDFAPGEQENNLIRAGYEALLENEGTQALFEQLREKDPSACVLIHPNNTKRVIRALEMADTGYRYSDIAKDFKTRVAHYPTCYIGLDLKREELYRRINERVDMMINEGLLGEVEELIDNGLLDTITASHAIGYKELSRVVTEGVVLSDAIDQIKQDTRRYAKRQLTWFKNDPRVKWICTDDKSATDIMRDADKIISSFEEGQ